MGSWSRRTAITTAAVLVVSMLLAACGGESSETAVGMAGTYRQDSADGAYEIVLAGDGTLESFSVRNGVRTSIGHGTYTVEGKDVALTIPWPIKQGGSAMVTTNLFYQDGALCSQMKVNGQMVTGVVWEKQ